MCVGLSHLQWCARSIICSWRRQHLTINCVRTKYITLLLNDSAVLYALCSFKCFVRSTTIMTTAEQSRSVLSPDYCYSSDFRGGERTSALSTGWLCCPRSQSASVFCVCMLCVLTLSRRRYDYKKAAFLDRRIAQPAGNRNIQAGGNKSIIS